MTVLFEADKRTNLTNSTDFNNYDSSGISYFDTFNENALDLSGAYDFDEHTTLQNLINDEEAKKEKRLKQAEQMQIQQENIKDFNTVLFYVFICIIFIFMVLVLQNTMYISGTVSIILIILAITVTIIYSAMMLVYTANKSTVSVGTFEWDFTRPKDKTKDVSTETFVPYNQNSLEESFIKMKAE
tara:strand:- start:3011 stop:3565 length:555 start_codon:yes stop_codon:yes gene_type:complete